MSIGMDHILRYKSLLLVTGILVLALVSLKVWVRDQHSAPDHPVSAAPDNNATLLISGIHYSDIKEGDIQLELTAETADFHMDDDRANLLNMQATFHEENGDKTFLFADSGTWDMELNDLEVSGNVVLKTNQYEMKTEILNYTDSKGLFSTQSAVAVHGVSLDMTAEGMKYFLDSKRIHLNGKEESDFGNDIEI
jgi:LPS export ABC transporter protein LptC